MFYLRVRSILRFAEVVYSSVEIYEQCFSLSACGARQMTEEWGELNINWHLEAFGAFYTPFWAAYDMNGERAKQKNYLYEVL
jgi:hypothetical protein